MSVPSAYPQPRRSGQVGRPTKMTEGVKKVLVEHVRACGYNAGAMAKVAGVNSSTILKHLADDPTFREQMEDAREVFLSRLEEEARRRAVEGFKEPHFSPAGKPYDVTRYSDALLVKLLKANGPEKYGDSVRVDKTVTVRAEIGLRRLSLDGQKRLLQLLDGEGASDAEFKLLGEDGDQPDQPDHGGDQEAQPAGGVPEQEPEDHQDGGPEHPVSAGRSHVPPLRPGDGEIHDEEEVGDLGHQDEGQDQEEAAGGGAAAHAEAYHEDEPEALDDDPGSL